MNFFGVALRAENLRWLHTMSAGVDSPIFSTFTDRGARLTTSSGSSAAPIARTVMLYLLALSRDLPGLIRSQDRAEWNWHTWSELGADRRGGRLGPDRPGGRPPGRGVRDGSDHRAPPCHGDEPYPVRPLDEIVHVAIDDDVMVALPLTPDTDGIVTGGARCARAEGLFVNVGRGELVDQPALTAALVDGRLGGAGIDVTTPEPLPADDPLWSAPNLIVTPHNSGSTDGTGADRTKRSLRTWNDGWRANSSTRSPVSWPADGNAWWARPHRAAGRRRRSALVVRQARDRSGPGGDPGPARPGHGRRELQPTPRHRPLRGIRRLVVRAHPMHAGADPRLPRTSARRRAPAARGGLGSPAHRPTRRHALLGRDRASGDDGGRHVDDARGSVVGPRSHRSHANGAGRRARSRRSESADPRRSPPT